MALDPVLYWNSVALEAHRRDYTFDDAFGDDEAGTAMDRQSLEPQQGGPTRTSRALAIVHLAIFDAFHAVKPIAVGGRTVSPYLPNLPAPPVPASLDAAFADAAVAGAASVTIQHLFGGRTVDPALKEFELSHLQQGTSLASLKGGLEFGAIVGRLHLDARANDKSDRRDGTSRNPAYRERGINGAFRQDPFAGRTVQPALGPFWGEVTPFGGYPSDVITTWFQPPQGRTAIGDYLNAGSAWTAELDEVLKVGADQRSPGVTRTAEQTLIGIFWGYDGARDIGVPPRLYNQCLREISLQAGPLAPAENAVLFALANMAMADAGIAAWREKYTYHVGRPVTVIREADVGFGPDRGPAGRKPAVSAPTLGAAAMPSPGSSYAAIEAWLQTPTTDTVQRGDPVWRPLGAPQTNSKTSPNGLGTVNRTPPFPAYPSGHATFGASCFEAARRVLEAFGHPSDASFDFVSDEFDGVSCDPDGSVRPLHRRGLTLAQAVHENAVSRLYLGVHWRMDAVEGTRIGLRIIDEMAVQQRGPASALPVPVIPASPAADAASATAAEAS